jgi:hypothetical protein
VEKFLSKERRGRLSPVSETIHGGRLSPESAEKLTLPPTVEEVMRAIKGCQRTKSSGPDGLSNAWCRDYAEDIAGPLTTLLGWTRMGGGGVR